MGHYEPGSAGPVFAGVFALFVIIFFLIVNAVTVVVFCMIFAKTGYSWALGLLMLVPIANIVMLFVLAFSQWPIQKELDLLRRQVNSGGQAGGTDRTL